MALFEGQGTGTPVGDTAELTALTRLLSGSVRQAALGSVTANIGHTGAAAGAAGLIKATLSIASGVLPPTTGCGSPHSLLAAPGAPLRVLSIPEPWPYGPRHAGVSATGFGGVHAHLVLTAPAPAEANNLMDPARPAPDRPSPDEPLVFAFSGEDAEAVRPVLERVADQATRWSEAELCDLAHALGSASAGPLRIAIVAGSAEQLSERAELALKRLDTLESGSLVALSGLYLGQDVKGRVTLLFPSQEAPDGDFDADRPIPDTASAETVAALWADTAIQDLTALYGDHPARPVDIWRDRVFVSNPCSSPQGAGAGAERAGGAPASGGGIAGIVMGLVAGVIARLPTSDEPEHVGRTGPVAGVSHWVRCFAEAPEPGGWDVPAAHEGADPDGEADGPEDAEIQGRRIVIDDPLRPGAAEALISAAREAVASRDRLAVVCASDAVSGFLGSLRLEHPDLDLGAGEPRARTVIALDGEGPLPVGPEDVVLVSGGGTGIGFACARALAEAAGCALALLGPRRPSHDPILRTNLQMLSVKGIRYGYAAADVSDAGEVKRAVRELERTLGPVTMLIHSADVNRPGRFAELTAEDFERHIAPKLTGLDNLLAATAPRRVVTFGSVIGLYGLAGESHYALANGLMRERVRRIGGLNIDWSVWSGAGMGERLGVLESLVKTDVTAIPSREGVELFLGLLRTKDLPSSVAVHGRWAGPPRPAREEGGSSKGCGCTSPAWSSSPTAACRSSPTPTWPTTGWTGRRRCPRWWRWRRWRRPRAR
ncbi:SDR family NAD(P)-dependent oxidoreductase [Streptosporangium lutulentum]